MSNSTVLFIRDTLLSVRNELQNEIDSLTDEQLNAKFSEDKWSISQVIRHLIMLDNLILPTLRKTMQEESERVTEKNLNFVLDRTKKMEAPGPEPLTEFIKKRDLLKVAKEARTPILEIINEFIDSTAMEDKSMIHPAFGPLSVKQ